MRNLSTKKNVSNTKIEENYMHVIGRIKLPQSAEVSSLYVQCNEAVSIDYNKDSPEIVLCKGGIVSSNSYFNSFYEKFYAKYTSINSIYYLLKLEGDFQVSIYREVYGKDNKELILTNKFESCHLSDFVKLRLWLAPPRPGSSAWDAHRNSAARTGGRTSSPGEPNSPQG